MLKDISNIPSKKFNLIRVVNYENFTLFLNLLIFQIELHALIFTNKIFLLNANIDT